MNFYYSQMVSFNATAIAVSVDLESLWIIIDSSTATFSVRNRREEKDKRSNTQTTRDPSVVKTRL